jgi:hypothetical protein
MPQVLVDFSIRLAASAFSKVSAVSAVDVAMPAS